VRLVLFSQKQVSPPRALLLVSQPAFHAAVAVSVLLRDIHPHLITNCDCKDTAPPQSLTDERARVGLSSQDGDAQHRVTMQILKHWQPFRDLKLMFAVWRRAERLRLRS
jgi:hypothetical protein